MSYDFFTDGIINSAVANGMIRIEFASISISEKEEDGRPKAQVSHRMVMTPHGFLKSLSNMEAPSMVRFCLAASPSRRDRC